MIDAVELLFSQEFLIRALVVGVFISLCCALLGVSLVLKRFSMIGDGLSHVGFGAMAIGAAAGFSPLYFALPIVIVSAFLLLRMNEKGKIKGDAAIALISTGALAVGVMATSMTTGMNIDIYNYMFGSILTMGKDDVIMSCVLSLCVIALFVIFYREIFAVTFDENFAKATGTKASAYNMLVAALTAVTIVIGMKMMGALLISSLIIFPTVTSMKLCKSFRSVVIFSSVISVLCFLSGLVFSIRFEAPTGASVVCVNIVLLLIISLIKAVKTSSLRPVFKYLAIASALLPLVVLFIFAINSITSDKNENNRISVVATTFAPYDFACEIAGEYADVNMLLAPGEESHTYEPTPADIMMIRQCDLFIYGGGESEKWVDTILDSLDENIKTVKMMDVVELHKEEHHHDEGEEHNEEYDEHVWTSPQNAMIISEEIYEQLTVADKNNSERYSENFNAYYDKLSELDKKFQTMIDSSDKNLIVIGDRFPLMYFTERYNLRYESAFPGCSAQAEVNPATLAKLIGTVKTEKIGSVFKVDLSKGSVAYTISEATGANVDTLYSCHVISAEDFINGESYISLMERNYSALETALK